MDKASRHELLRIVEGQQEKLAKYEAKLKGLRARSQSSWAHAGHCVPLFADLTPFWCLNV